MFMIVILILAISLLAAGAVYGAWETYTKYSMGGGVPVQDIIALLVLFVALHSMWLDLMNRVAAQ